MVWSTIKQYGTSRWVRYSYFWLFFVPVAAKLLSSVPEHVAINLGGQPFNLTLALPFSWVLFYFGALGFSAAYFIYFWACPRLIRDYGTFSDYESAGKGPNYVRDQLYGHLIAAERRASYPELGRIVLLCKYFIVRFCEINRPDYVAEYERKYRTGKYDVPHGPAKLEPLKEHLPMNLGLGPLTILEEKTPDAFWFVRTEVFDRSKKPIRVLCSCLYLAGYAAHLWVAWQGLNYVWRFAW